MAQFVYGYVDIMRVAQDAQREIVSIHDHLITLMRLGTKCRWLSVLSFHAAVFDRIEAGLASRGDDFTELERFNIRESDPLTLFTKQPNQPAARSPVKIYFKNKTALALAQTNLTSPVLSTCAHTANCQIIQLPHALPEPPQIHHIPSSAWLGSETLTPKANPVTYINHPLRVHSIQLLLFPISIHKALHSRSPFMKIALHLLTSPRSSGNLIFPLLTRVLPLFATWFQQIPSAKRFWCLPRRSVPFQFTGLARWSYDSDVASFLAYGWPINYRSSSKPAPSDSNHFPVVNFAKVINNFTETELSYEATAVPFNHDSIPSTPIFSSW